MIVPIFDIYPTLGKTNASKKYIKWKLRCKSIKWYIYFLEKNI